MFPFPSGGTDTILVVGPSEEDDVILQSAFCNSCWSLHKVSSCSEALAFLQDHRVPVVICEHDLPDGDWRDILSGPPTREDRPLLIVASRLADEVLWAKVLGGGGYDLLASPIDAGEVIRLVTFALAQERNKSQPTATIASGVSPSGIAFAKPE